MIKVNHLSKHFAKNKQILKAVDDVSVEIPLGQTVAIIGPSGSGKSTFLRCINGLEAATFGSISIANTLLDLESKDIDQFRAEVGMVFQHFNLFPHLSVLGNICLAPNIVQHQTRKKREQLAHTLLEKVGLADRANSFPSHLSGGQKQRVAIARALAMQPKVMLFDEPTSALDPEMVGEVLDVITDLSKQGMTILLVTHEMSFARSVAHRVLFFDHGKLVEDAPDPQAFFTTPNDQRARDFLGKVLH